MAIEIVDLPSYKMVIFHSYVCLPEFFFDLLYVGDYHNTIGIHVCLEILTSWRWVVLDFRKPRILFIRPKLSKKDRIVKSQENSDQWIPMTHWLLDLVAFWVNTFWVRIPISWRVSHNFGISKSQRVPWIQWRWGQSALSNSSRFKVGAPGDGSDGCVPSMSGG